MWSKTRQVLLSKLAPSLQGRVNFIREEFTTKKLKYWSTRPVFRVTVDGKTWFATGYYDFWQFIPARFMQRELVSNNKKLAEKIGDAFWKEPEGDRTGLVGYAIHEYFNVLSLEECLKPEQGFCNILAVLDYRLGKRRLRKMLEEIDSCPDFLYKWILLRAEAEGLLEKKKEVG